MATEWIPKPYQLEAVKFILKNPHSGLVLPPGMRKTSNTLTAMVRLMQAGVVKRTLIICPIRPMYKVWPDEIKKWNHLNHLSITILHGDDKLARLTSPLKTDIYIINPEGLKWFFLNKGMDILKPDWLIVDESTKFKDSSSARFKLLKPFLSWFTRRTILTGEPAPNGYLDLFGQCFIMDMGKTLGKFITHYRMEYFYQDGYGGYDWTLRPGADELIQKRLKGSVMSLELKGNIDMPELVPNDIYVDLPTEARKIYKDMEDEFIAEVKGKTIIAITTAVSGGKCRQIANGGLYDEDHVAHHVHNAKTDAIKDLVEQLQGQSLLVAYEFQHDLDRLKAAFPNAPCLTGVTGPKLDRIIDDFNAGKVPVLLASPQSAGHGLNLQEHCWNVCYYGIGWDLDTYNQFYKRVWRSGQKSKVVVLHRIIADKTVDIIVTKSLLNKDGTQSAFLQAIRSM